MPHSLPLHQDEIEALLAGRMTQVRRPLASVKGLARVFEVQGSSKPGYDVRLRGAGGWGWQDFTREQLARRCTFASAGKTIEVREALERVDGIWVYQADEAPLVARRAQERLAELGWGASQRFCPALKMPVWTSRWSLEVKSVRVQRIDEVSDEEALAEGIRQVLYADPPRFLGGPHPRLASWQPFSTAHEAFRHRFLHHFPPKTTFDETHPRWLWTASFWVNQIHARIR